MSKLALVLSRITLDFAQESQISSLIVQLSNEKHEGEEFETELESLANILASRSSDKLLVVKRWAKRIICDERYSVGKLLKYMKSDEKLNSLSNVVQSIVDSKDNAAVNKLSL
jgi:predicted GH43/DUF377 family glycosyl hydrolase